MRKLSALSQILIITGGLVVLIGLIFFFIVFPILEDIEGSAQQWVRDQKRLLAFGRSEQEVQKLTDEVARINEINPLIQKTLIKKDQTIAFIVALENIGKALKISYDISIGGITPLGRGVSTQSFQVSLNGPYISIARFIEAVESMPQYTQVNSVGISRRGSEVSASINLSAFVKND